MTATLVVGHSSKNEPAILKGLRFNEFDVFLTFDDSGDEVLKCPSSMNSVDECFLNFFRSFVLLY